MRKIPEMRRIVDRTTQVFDDKGIKALYKDIQKDATANMEKLTKQMVRRVPRLVGKRVSEKYNIPASEIYPPAYKVKVDKATGEKKEVKKLARVKVKGDTLSTLNFTWSGRRPTLQRFKPKPNVVPTNREPYDITFSVLRGKRQQLKTPQGYRNFVANLNNSGTHIVYATTDREGWRNRLIIDPVRVMSVPIMIDQEDVQKNIRKDINASMIKELKGLYKK